MPAVIRSARGFTRTAILLFILCLPSITLAGTLSIIGDGRWVSVAKVYDGDTFKTRSGEKVRLLNLNTPEIQHRDNRAQVGGNKAAFALKKLILGKQVRLSFDKEKKDRYGRTLAHVWMQDGLWVNQYMVEEGYAHVYTFEPNTRWVKKLLKAEHIAQEEKRGIWATKRFKLLNSQSLSSKFIGQFRVIRGKVDSIKNWSFRTGKLHVSIAKKARKIFQKPPVLRLDQTITIRGKIRISSKGKIFLSLYSPADLELK